MFSVCSLEPNTPINFMSGCTLAFSPLYIFFVPVFRLHIFLRVPWLRSRGECRAQNLFSSFLGSSPLFSQDQGAKTQSLFTRAHMCSTDPSCAHAAQPNVKSLGTWCVSQPPAAVQSARLGFETRSAWVRVTWLRRRRRRRESSQANAGREKLLLHFVTSSVSVVSVGAVCGFSASKS